MSTCRSTLLNYRSGDRRLSLVALTKILGLVELYLDCDPSVQTLSLCELIPRDRLERTGSRDFEALSGIGRDAKQEAGKH